VSVPACSLPCMSFLFLDQKIIPERHLPRAQEQSNLRGFPALCGPIASPPPSQAVLQKDMQSSNLCWSQPCMSCAGLPRTLGHEEVSAVLDARRSSAAGRLCPHHDLVYWSGRAGDKGLTLLGGDLLWVLKAFIPTWRQISVLPPAMRGTFTVSNAGSVTRI